MAKQQFQLRPKHLVTATLVVCVLAIIALIIGVVGTFKPRNEERRQDGQEQRQEQDVNRVEVWKPNGRSEEAVILNPDAVDSVRGQGGQNTADDEQAARNPFLPSSPSRHDGEDAERHARPQSEDSQRARPTENQPAQPSPSLQGPTVEPPSPEGQAVPAQPRSEPEPRPEPKPEPSPPPAPQPKPQQQNVIDNLF